MFLVFDHEAKRLADNFLDNGISYLGYYRSDKDEYGGFFEKDLDFFFTILDEADTIVGYNIVGYDIPILQRYRAFDFGQKNVIDIFKEIADTHKVFLKLDNLVSTTLNASKIAHGLDAIRFVNTGQFDKLKEYCDMDVKLTKELYEYICKHGYCYYTDGVGKKVRIELNFNNTPNAAKDTAVGLF